MTHLWNSQGFFSYDWWTSFATFFFFSQLTEEFLNFFHMTVWFISQYFPQSINVRISLLFFFSRLEKEINRKGTSEKAVRTTSHIKYSKMGAGCCTLQNYDRANTNNFLYYFRIIQLNNNWQMLKLKY